MMMKMVLAAALVGACCATPAFAEAQIDQVNLFGGSYSAELFALADRPYQSFTAGLTGALVSFGLQILNPTVGRLDVGVYTFDAASRLPGGRIGTASFSYVKLPGTAAEVWFFSTDAFVVAGQQYAIQIRTESRDSFWLATKMPFSGGIAGRKDRPETDYSLGFVTNVDTDLVPPPAAIPEPATWAFMVSGFGLIGGAVRRRRHGVTNITFDSPG